MIVLDHLDLETTDVFQPRVPAAAGSGGKLSTLTWEN